VKLHEKALWYYREYGARALVARILQVLMRSEARHPEKTTTDLGGGYTPVAPESTVNSGPTEMPMVATHLAQRFNQIQPLPVFVAPGPKCRLNLVTDSINEGSLFGGVGTAILLAALVATKRNASLRIVTRTQSAHEAGFGQVLECNGITFDGNIEFAFVDVADPLAQLDICDGDRFLTTSWWTTASVLGSVPAEHVDYLLQEDERMFYPHGDDWLRCNELLERRDIRFLVNTELLYRHFIQTGLEHFRAHAEFFEPAFPASAFRASARKVDGSEPGKRRLFFYARPHNLRNLFYRGIEALDEAVSRGVIDPQQWEVVFIGKDVPPVSLGGLLQPLILPPMSWKDYGAFVRSVDLGFCLMATPHPSYPPLDLAASGAVVITNRFGLKQDLSTYSDNIIVSGASVAELVAGLEQGVQLAADTDLRARNYAMNRLSRSWSESLADAVERWA
jgi:O-antigen biosynthesis protein